MTAEIDARGLSCPQPVILAEKAILSGKFPIRILVDTVTACENVRRLAERNSLSIQIREMGEEFELSLTKKE
jgi:tRNA 2-thiouridine synthesizing protein A